jgi:hypothetical protein
MVPALQPLGDSTGKCGGTTYIQEEWTMVLL